MRYAKPRTIIPIASILTLISLAPFGWIIGLAAISIAPKLIRQKQSTTSTICAKCGTLSKKGQQHVKAAGMHSIK